MIRNTTKFRSGLSDFIGLLRRSSLDDPRVKDEYFRFVSGVSNRLLTLKLVKL
jgi:hypothetical protein